MKKVIEVNVQNDHLKKLATGKPEMALSELIWNALDADATDIQVEFIKGHLGVETIAVKDNGQGVSYKDAENFFGSLGGSWKAKCQKTNSGRFLHGKEGKGRFKAFVLGSHAVWRIIYKNNEQYKAYEIKGRITDIKKFTLTEETNIDSIQTGVRLEINELTRDFHVLDAEKAVELLTPIFALYLSSYSNISISIDDLKIDPLSVIKNRAEFQLTEINDNEATYPVSLEIIEWNVNSEKKLYFCDENGFPIDHYDRAIPGVGEFSFSAYLKSNYIKVLQDKGLIGFASFRNKNKKSFDEAIQNIKDYFKERLLEAGRDQIDEWKEEKIYPYSAEPQNSVEKAERQIFDIIALNINQSLPDFKTTNKKAKAFQLRMLKQAVGNSPEELQHIISEVMNLPKDKQDQLADLLKETSLTSIITASKLVSDRLKFLAGLDFMLFDPDIKKHFKERSQLHRIIAKNTWLFGDAFSLSADDQSLTEVLSKHVKAQNKKIIINDPVKRMDGKTGIVDLMLSRAVPLNRAKDLEHLIVELKAPKVSIGQKEIEQVKSYAFAIARDERFRGLNTRWSFWVISNDIDEYAEMELSQEKYEDGVIFKTTTPSHITVWIKTWSQLLQENKHRLEFIKNKLNYNIDQDEAIDYLRKTYSEYTHGLI